jgi:hypothetical protein
MNLTLKGFKITLRLAALAAALIAVLIFPALALAEWRCLFLLIAQASVAVRHQAGSLLLFMMLQCTC